MTPKQRFLIAVLVLACGFVWLSIGFAEESKPAETTPQDPQTKAYGLALERATQQYKETLAPAQKLRDERIRQAVAAYSPVAARASQAYQDAVKKAAATAANSYENAISEAVKKGNLDAALGTRHAKEIIMERAAKDLNDLPNDKEDSILADVMSTSNVIPALCAGYAGAADAGNVYSSMLVKRYPKLTLRFWVATEGKGDTDGNVFLIDPSGSQTNIWAWHSKDKLPSLLLKDLDPMGDRKRAKEVSINISSLSGLTGLYRVKFHYTGGSSGLCVLGAQFEPR